MNIFEILFFGLACGRVFSATVPQRFPKLNRKPFNCLPCMTGWCSLFVAMLAGADYYLLYAPAGLFVGMLFCEIQMRWL